MLVTAVAAGASGWVFLLSVVVGKTLTPVCQGSGACVIGLHSPADWVRLHAADCAASDSISETTRSSSPLFQNVRSALVAITRHSGSKNNCGKGARHSDSHPRSERPDFPHDLWPDVIHGGTRTVQICLSDAGGRVRRLKREAPAPVRANGIRRAGNPCRAPDW